MTVPFFNIVGKPLICHRTTLRRAVNIVCRQHKSLSLFQFDGTCGKLLYTNLGAFVSSIVATGKPSLSRTATNSSNLFFYALHVSRAKKLKRATFIPLFINSSTTFGSFVAGPSVQTIFVFLIFYPPKLFHNILYHKNHGCKIKYM